MDAGMLPLSALYDSTRYLSDVIVATQLGSGPFNLLLATENTLQKGQSQSNARIDERVYSAATASGKSELCEQNALHVFQSTDAGGDTASELVVLQAQKSAPDG